jgi:hypothetical protein
MIKIYLENVMEKVESEQFIIKRYYYTCKKRSFAQVVRNKVDLK